MARLIGLEKKKGKEIIGAMGGLLGTIGWDR